MPSRWQKRTEAEKQAILDKQRAQEKAVQEKNKHWSERESNVEEFMRIYKNNEIPLHCGRCDGWSTSEKYVIDDYDFYGTKTAIIKGQCKKCGTRTDRIFPTGNLNELMILGMTMMTLTVNGRLFDRRTGKPEAPR